MHELLCREIQNSILVCHYVEEFENYWGEQMKHMHLPLSHLNCIEFGTTWNTGVVSHFLNRSCHERQIKCCFEVEKCILIRLMPEQKMYLNSLTACPNNSIKIHQNLGTTFFNIRTYTSSSARCGFDLFLLRKNRPIFSGSSHSCFLLVRIL
jgi:hypothetical protein